MSGTINRARGAGDSPCQNCSQHFRILVNGCRPLRGLVSFICLGPGVSLATLASPQALCERALRALFVNVRECVNYVIPDLSVQSVPIARSFPFEDDEALKEPICSLQREHEDRRYCATYNSLGVGAE